MQISKLFDYIFFRLSSFFERNGGEDLFRSVSILSIIQSANLLIVYNLISIMYRPFECPSILILVLGTLFFIILNTIRYKKFITYKELKEAWIDEDKSLKLKKGLYLIVYVVLSIIVLGITSNLAQ